MHAIPPDVLNALFGSGRALGLSFSQQGGFSHGTLGQAASQAQGYPYAPPHPGYIGAIGTALAQQGPGAPAEPLEDAGIRAGEIIGWRCWRLTNGLLQSMAMDTVWAPGEPMEGMPGDHDVSGVNAFRTQSGALTYAQQAANHSDRSIVIGQIEMWGRVIEHELGYRSECAQIVSLCRIMRGERRFRSYDIITWEPPRRSLLDRLLGRPIPEEPKPPAPPTPEERLARLREEYGVGGMI